MSPTPWNSFLFSSLYNFLNKSTVLHHLSTILLIRDFFFFFLFQKRPRKLRSQPLYVTPRDPLRFQPPIRPCPPKVARDTNVCLIKTSLKSLDATILLIKPPSYLFSLAIILSKQYNSYIKLKFSLTIIKIKV